MCSLIVLLSAAEIIRRAWAWALIPDRPDLPELIRVVEVRVVSVRTNGVNELARRTGR